MGNDTSQYESVPPVLVPETAAVLDKFARSGNPATFCREVIADSQRREKALCEELLKIVDSDEVELKNKAIKALANAVETEEKARRRLAKLTDAKKHA